MGIFYLWNRAYIYIYIYTYGVQVRQWFSGIIGHIRLDYHFAWFVYWTILFVGFFPRAHIFLNIVIWIKHQWTTHLHWLNKKRRVRLVSAHMVCCHCIVRTYIYIYTHIKIIIFFSVLLARCLQNKMSRCVIHFSLVNDWFVYA